MTKTENCPVYPIHPGRIRADELLELNMSAAELAHQRQTGHDSRYRLAPRTSGLASRLPFG